MSLQQPVRLLLPIGYQEGEELVEISWAMDSKALFDLRLPQVQGRGLALKEVNERSWKD